MPSVMITLYVLFSIDFRLPLSWHFQIIDHGGTQLFFVSSDYYESDAEKS